MVEVTKTIRNLDEDAYRRFRATAVALGISTGDALTEALRIWVNARTRPRVTVRAGVEDTARELAPAIAGVA